MRPLPPPHAARILPKLHTLLRLYSGNQAERTMRTKISQHLYSSFTLFFSISVTLKHPFLA